MGPPSKLLNAAPIHRSESFSPAVDEVLAAPPSERRDLVEQHVRGVAKDLGIKLPEPSAVRTFWNPHNRFAEMEAHGAGDPAAS
jgi:hypothetical protein